MVSLIVHKCWCTFPESLRVTIPSLSNPHRKVLPYNLDASEIRQTHHLGCIKNLVTSWNKNYQLPSTSTWWVGPGFLVCINSNSILTSRRNIPRSIPSVHEPARRVQSTLGCCFLRRKNNFSPGGLGRWCRTYMYIYMLQIDQKKTKKIHNRGDFWMTFWLDAYEFSKDYIWFTWRTGGTITPSTAVEYCWKTRRDGGSWWRRPHSARWDLRCADSHPRPEEISQEQGRQSSKNSGSWVIIGIWSDQSE